MTRLIHRLSFITRVVWILSVAGSIAFAQQPQYPYAVDTKPSRGIMPNSEQLSGPLDNIDPISGKLHIQIPLASLPAGHAGSGFDLSLTYDSHLFDLYAGEVADGRISQSISSSLNGGGWYYNFANYRLEVEQRYIPTWEQPTCDGDSQYVMEHERVYRYRISLPDGSQHLLHLLGYGDEKGDGYYGDGFYAITMNGARSNCAQSNPNRYPSNVTGTLTYFTTDGSYLRFQINATGGVPTNQTWTLFYPDGRRVIGRGDRAEHIYDANGNGIHIANQTENGHIVTYISDDFGRSIRLENSLTSSINEREDKITAVGPGGVLEWRVKWQRLQIGGAGFSYICYQDDPAHPTYTATCPINFQFWVVKYIQLPFAAPDFVSPPADPWKSLEFTYSPNGQGYGHLLTMRAPGGATYTYCCDAYSPSFYAQDIAYAGYASRTVDHDGVVDRWTYQAIDRTSMRVTAPDGGQTIYHYYDPQIASQFWSRNLVYWIEEPGGTVRKRQWTRNKVFTLAAAINIDSNNPYVERESVTIDRVAGEPRTTVTDTLIDKNGNALQTLEYNWSTTVSGQFMEAPGTLERTTQRTYHVSVPASTNAANGSNRYWSPSAPLRLNAIADQIIRDATSAIRSVSEFQYDAPLTKGNLTFQRQWDDSRAGCAPSIPLSLNCPVRHREYDATGNLIDIFEPEVRTHITYDGAYPVLVEYAPGTGSLRSFAYEWNQAAGSLQSQTDVQSGTVTTYGYDPYGRQSRVDVAGMRLSQTIYSDESRTVLTKQDLRAHEDGLLETSTHIDQLGRVDFVRTSDGAPLTPNGSDGIKTSTSYKTFPGGTFFVTSRPYRSTSDTTLEWTCTQKDQAGRVTAVAMFKGGTSPAGCDSMANRTGITVTDYHSEAGPPRTRVVDPAGKTADRFMDALGRLTSIVEDPAGLAYATTYQYDALGNLIKAIQVEAEVVQQRDFAYTSLGRLKTTNNPESGTIDYTYNDRGNLLTRRDGRGYTTTFRYDELHRVLEKTFLNDGDVTPDVIYAYHVAGPCAGQVQSVTSETGSMSYNNCDSLGHLLNQTQVIVGAGSFDFNYTHWLTGGLKTMQYPSGKLVSFDVDDAARVMKIFTTQRVYADLTEAASPYTADGRVARIKLGNNLWESREYQAPGTPTLMRLGTMEGLADKLELQYNYAPFGNNGNLMSQVITRGNASWAQTYEYDGLNRLACATETLGNTPAASCTPENSWRQTFGYDRFGNRWVSSSAGFLFSDVHEPTVETNINKWTNQLNASLFDPAGNQLLFTPWSLEYDAENRLTAATSSSNGSSWFTYDGEGRRIKKVTATPDLKTTFYVYDASGRLAAEYSTQPSVSSTSYLFADYLGTPRAITDQDGTVIDCSDYSPFGRLLETPTRTLPCQQTPNHAAQQFTGKERDAGTGLDYFGARYFSSAQGRFITPDPDSAGAYIGLPQTLNAYAYTANNPLSRIDPDGRDWVGQLFYKLGLTTSPETGLFDDVSAQEFTHLPGEFKRDHDKIPLIGIPTSATEFAFAFTPVGKIAGPLAKAARLQAVLKTVEPKLAKVIARAAGKPFITVLGKWGTYEKLAERLSANKFHLSDAVWKAMSHEERWAANRKFLDEAIKRGDEIILSNFVPNIDSQVGFFRMELDYLLQNGYELGAEGYSMIRRVRR